MQILSVQLKNIKSHRDVTLSFSPGINVLAGPNGVGKSTVFEAVGYALFGVDARDFVGNLERFVTIGEKKGEIAVVFRPANGETFRVTRTVGAGSKWLLARENNSDFEVEDHANAQETESRLRELLGLDNGRPLAEQFKLVIGPFQNDFLGPFVIKQPTKRQEAFDEILGIDAWRKTFKGTNVLLAAVQEKIRLLITEIEEKRSQAADLPPKKSELKEILDLRKKKGTELEAQQATLKQATEQVSRFEEQKGRLEGAENALKETLSRIETGKEYLVRQQGEVERAEAAVTVVNQSRPGKEAFEQAEAQLAELRRQEQQRRAAEQEVAALEKEAVRLAGSLDQEKNALDQVREELAGEEARLAESRKSLQATSEILAAAGRLEELRKTRDDARGERDRLRGKRANLVEGRDKLAEGICPFFQEPCRNIADKEPRTFFDTKVEDIDRQIRALDKRIESLGEELGAAEKARQQVEARAVRAEELNRQEKALTERKQKTRERAEGLKNREAEKMAAEQKAAEARKELSTFAGLDDRIAQKEQEKQRHQPARDAYARNEQAAGELPRRRETLQKYQDRLKELESTQQAQQSERDRLAEAYRPELHETIRQEKDRLLHTVATLQEQVEGLGREKARLEGEIEKLMGIVRELEARQAEKKKFEEKQELVMFLRNQVFKNVSAQLSERFREEISLRADRIYRTIAEADEELCWGENYRIVLRDLVDGQVRERSDDQLSGGQTMSAVVALRLALLQTIGARVAFFDEPTSNLDADRRENLARAFRAIDVGKEEVTEHWYDQLFLVSHDVAFTEITDQITELGG